MASASSSSNSLASRTRRDSIEMVVRHSHDAQPEASHLIQANIGGYKDDPEGHAPLYYSHDHNDTDEPQEHLPGFRGTTQTRRRPRRCIPTTTNTVFLMIIFALAVALGYQNRHAIPSAIRNMTSSSDVAGSQTLSFQGSAHARSCLCPHTKTGERICGTYTPASLKRSHLHEGTNVRFKNVLARFDSDRRRGSDQKLKVGIMGGSVSACHGVTPNHDMLAPDCYGRIFANWLDKRLGGRGNGHEDVVEIENGAIGGMDSSYYAFCGTNHLHPDVDVVILEFDVNDQADRKYVTYFDQLVRIILSFPSNPAVIILGSWGPLLGHDQGSYTPMWAHLPVAIYYDVPYVSIQPMILDTYLRFPHSVSEVFFNPDGFHPTAKGQHLLADILVGYFESVLCEVDRDKYEGTSISDGWSKDVSFVGGGQHTTDKAASFDAIVKAKSLPTLGGPDAAADTYAFLSLPNATSVPPLPLPNPMSIVINRTQPDPTSWTDIYTEKNLKPKPFCADANDRKSPLKPKKNQGWRPMVWKNEKHFWVSDTVGASISVDIKANEGRVAVYYFRSETLSPGIAMCWVDDNRAGAKKLEGYWPLHQNVPSVSYIDSLVTPGDHFVTCEISPESHDPTSPFAHHFRIVAIMAT